MPREVLHQGRKIQLIRDTEILPDGRQTSRELVLHPGAVAIVPVLDADRLCLLRNVRPAVGQTLWEIPAGTLEKGENPDDAARRELAEETGYRAGQLRKFAEIIPSPGVMSEIIHLYVAEELTPGPMQLEPDEQLETHIVTWQQALTWAMDGTIRDAKSLIALFWLDRQRSCL